MQYKTILIHAWTLQKKEKKYYIPFTHWVYLQEIVKYYDRVCLLAPTKMDFEEDNKFETISDFSNVDVYELPYSNGYLDAVKFFFKYRRAYKELAPNFDVVYARYPIPFGWLQNYYFKNKRRIIHFVGDPIDTIINNPKLSSFKKLLYTQFFKPEHYMYIQACKEAEVFTNGFHLSEKLKNVGIVSEPLISSTLNDEDFYFESKVLNVEAPRLIYVGYLRKAKGVETVIKAFEKLQAQKPLSSLTIVGQGEEENYLKSFVKNRSIDNVEFIGHVDNRDYLNNLLRKHDIFCFASLSEGSPRVILEAMANGLAILSTPVGSLPVTFVNNHEIVFANFDDYNMFFDKLMCISNQPDFYEQLRNASFNKVKDYKINSFLKKIFYEA
ncbi:glycosyltransferase [Sphingobacterium sp.]|uniref:glycosyltransferase n=1 Tax=Sphingobacterium sp. TaxID=341027 RepID=UPI0028AA4B79|nr:glycosyltransferase [Sphingobacterium sp.]